MVYYVISFGISGKPYTMSTLVLKLASNIVKHKDPTNIFTKVPTLLRYAIVYGNQDLPMDLNGKILDRVDFSFYP